MKLQKIQEMQRADYRPNAHNPPKEDPHNESVLDKDMVLEDSVRAMLIANDMAKAMRANGERFETEADDIFSKAYRDFKSNLDEYVNRKIEDTIRARTTW